MGWHLRANFKSNICHNNNHRVWIKLGCNLYNYIAGAKHCTLSHIRIFNKQSKNISLCLLQIKNLKENSYTSVEKQGRRKCTETSPCTDTCLQNTDDRVCVCSASTEIWRPGTFSCQRTTWWRSATSAWPETFTKTQITSGKATYVCLPQSHRAPLSPAAGQENTLCYCIKPPTWWLHLSVFAPVTLYLLRRPLRLACLWSGWPQRASSTKCTPARVTCGLLESSSGKSFHSVISESDHTWGPSFVIHSYQKSANSCRSGLVPQPRSLDMLINAPVSPLCARRCFSVSGGADWWRLLQTVERWRQNESTGDGLSWNVNISSSYKGEMGFLFLSSRIYDLKSL